MSLCRSFFCGRVVRDIEVKQSKEGKSYADFTLAVDSGFGENRYSNYFSLVAYNNNAENLAKYVSKGTKIIVECTPRQHRWQDKDGHNQSREIHMVNTWEFAESRNAQQPTQQTQVQQPVQQPVNQPVQQQSTPQQPTQQTQQTSQSVSQPQPQANPKPWDMSEDLPFV
jgi:single-strand DNA-binding protein